MDSDESYHSLSESEFYVLSRTSDKISVPYVTKQSSKISMSFRWQMCKTTFKLNERETVKKKKGARLECLEEVFS